ncbi:MAG: PEP-CTERM sorting domain-containing protein [Armatimonadota bacterium]|nr:PEP-CTERM sorting domain-containing protein [Armatimonadota bacterium]
MTTRYPFLGLAALLLTAATVASGATMPRGSFLRQPAQSAAQLAAQVRKDPVVASRYERHYRVSASQFANYVQSQLGLRRLSKSGRYRVFYVRPDGSIGSQMRSLRKGTAVFLHLRTGEPVLLAECGNPMGTGLPGYLRAEANGNRSMANASPEASALGEEEILNSPPVATAPDPWSEHLAPSELLSDLPVEGADLKLSIPDVVVPHAAYASHSPFALLAPLLMAGVSGVFSAGIHGSPPGRGTPTPPPPAVPEPSSLVLWAAAGGGILLMRARRKALHSYPEGRSCAGQQ